MKTITFLALLFCAYAATVASAQEASNPEIEKIDKRLEELKLIWHQEQAVINGFTKNRTVPVREGTKEYHACVKASGRIKLAEEEAAMLKNQRSAILNAESGKSGSGDGGTGDGRDAALAKMTNAEKLEVLEKDAAIVKEMGEISAKATRRELNFAAADQMLKRLALERVNLYQSKQYEEEAKEVEDAYKEELERIKKMKEEIAKESGSPPIEPESNMKDADTPGIQGGETNPETRPTLEGLSPLRKKLVGYWISVQEVNEPPTYELDEGATESDLSEEAKIAKRVTENMRYNYSCYGPNGFLKGGEWEPYKEVRENEDIIEIEYFFRTAGFRRILKQRIKIISLNEMVELNDGGQVAYKRISDKEWIERAEGIEWFIEDDAQAIKSKMPLSKDR